MPRISDYPPSYGLKDSDRFVVDDMSEDQTLSYTGKQLKNYVNDVRTTSSVMAFAEAIKDPEQYMNVQNEATGKHSKLQMVDMDRYIKGLITGLYRFRGTVSYNDLVNKTGVEAGDVYNVNEKFITTDAFLEGSGKTYDAGTNVVWTDQNKWDVMGGLSIDLSDYATNESVEEKIEGALDDYQKVIELKGLIDFNDLTTPGIYYNEHVSNSDRLNAPELPDGYPDVPSDFLYNIIIEVLPVGGPESSTPNIIQYIKEVSNTSGSIYSRTRINNNWSGWKYGSPFTLGYNNDGAPGYFNRGTPGYVKNFHFFGEEAFNELFTTKFGPLADDIRNVISLLNLWNPTVAAAYPIQIRNQVCLSIMMPTKMSDVIHPDWTGGDRYHYIIGERGDIATRVFIVSKDGWTNWKYTPPAINAKIDDSKGMYIHKSSIEGFGTAICFGQYNSTNGSISNTNGALTLRAVNDTGEKILDVGSGEDGDETITVPFSFGVDANGKYGYFKKDSNTVTPFVEASSSVTVEAIESDDGLSGFSMYDNEFIQLDVSGRTVNNKFNLTINNLGTQTNGTLELPFSFGVDANGNYGYKKKGADTVIPFKSAGSIPADGNWETERTSLTAIFIACRRNKMPANSKFIYKKRADGSGDIATTIDEYNKEISRAMEDATLEFDERNNPTEQTKALESLMEIFKASDGYLHRQIVDGVASDTFIECITLNNEVIDGICIPGNGKWFFF